MSASPCWLELSDCPDSEKQRGEVSFQPRLGPGHRNVPPVRNPGRGRATRTVEVQMQERDGTAGCDRRSVPTAVPDYKPEGAHPAPHVI